MGFISRARRNNPHEMDGAADPRHSGPGEHSPISTDRPAEFQRPEVYADSAVGQRSPGYAYGAYACKVRHLPRGPAPSVSVRRTKQMVSIPEGGDIIRAARWRRAVCAGIRRRCLFL